MAYTNVVVDIQNLVEKGHSVGEACEIHGREIGKSKNAVSLAYYRRKQPGEVHGNSCLIEEEQKSLLYIAIALVNIQKPWTVDQMHKVVEDMFSKKISRSTIQHFLTKHSDDLGLGNTTPLSNDRASAHLYDETVYFVEKMKKFFAMRTPLLFAFVNYDECWILLTQEGKLQIKRLVSKKAKKSQNRSGIKGTHCGTFLPFVGADRMTLVTYFVFAAKFKEGDTTTVHLDLPNTSKQT